MRILHVMLLFHTSLQLVCDKRKIKAHIGDEFVLKCTYDDSFRFSKKYWCRGESRSTCEILSDSEGVSKSEHTHRMLVVDLGWRGLYVKVTKLQIEDTHVYWVGIDKIYADIMLAVDVKITQVPVSKPVVLPLTSLRDRSSCWGSAVTVRCSCTSGTQVRYTWHQQKSHKALLLHNSSDLVLHCGMMGKDRSNFYYCTARNDISSQQSNILSVQALLPGNSSCIYTLHIPGQAVYDCADYLDVLDFGNQSLQSNQSLRSNQSDSRHSDSRERAGIPLWYFWFRWSAFAALLITLCIVIKCTQKRHRKRVKKSKKIKVKDVSFRST